MPRVHLPSNVCLKSLMSCFFSCEHVSFSLPSPQIKWNCRTGKALKHTEVLLWYLVIRVQHSNLLAGFATGQTNCSDRKPIFNRKMNSCVRSAYSGAKIHLCIQGKDSNSCKKLSRNQNTSVHVASQKSPAMSGAHTSIRSFLQSSL